MDTLALHTPLLGRYLSALEAQMQAITAVPCDAVQDFYGYLHYHMGWANEQLQPSRVKTGKRIRPLLCLLACTACGGDWERALPAAAAVELLHNFTLIHDDIEDNDTTRRGRPTVWSLWGMPQALNAGDALHTLAHLALLRLREQGVSPDTVVEALGVLDRTCLRLTEGQFMDLSFEEQENVGPETYLDMVERKTAALVAAACELGALIAGAPPAQREQLRAFGHHLGLAFQIRDDVLGVWGDPQVTGKPAVSDILRRKKTLPILYGLRRSEPLRALLARPDLSPADVTRVVELLESTGSRSWAQDQAREHTDRAIEALDRASLDGPAATALRELTLGLLGRDH